jgi:hypothetical protein
LTVLETSLAPEHSIVFVSDLSQKETIPAITRSGNVWATSSCIAVGTLAYMDGPTHIVLADESLSNPRILVFSGKLATPGRRIAISDSSRTAHLSMPVSNPVTNLQILANDIREPTEILVQAT